MTTQTIHKLYGLLRYAVFGSLIFFAALLIAVLLWMSLDFLHIKLRLTAMIQAQADWGRGNLSDLNCEIAVNTTTHELGRCTVKHHGILAEYWCSLNHCRLVETDSADNCGPPKVKADIGGGIHGYCDNQDQMLGTWAPGRWYKIEPCSSPSAGYCCSIDDFAICGSISRPPPPQCPSSPKMH